MSESKWFSVMEIEKETGIPDATIRRYIRNHGHHLQIKKRGKVYLISSESIPVIRKIRELYDKGKQLDDIEDGLKSMNVPVTVTMNENGKDVTVNASEVLVQLQKDMNEQKKFNQLLLETLQKQQEYIDNKLEERDRKLMESIRSLQEAKKEIAAADSQQEDKKGFFKRIFKR